MTHLRVGDRVEVTEGLAKGLRGTIVRKWERPFGRPEEVPSWIVRFAGDLVGERVLPELYLRVVP